MSLRQKIEAKAARTAVLPIQVGDAAAAAAEVATVRAALSIHNELLRQRVEEGGEELEEDRRRADSLREQLGAAVAAERETVVSVTLRALPPDLWDAILEAAPEDEEEGVDLSAVRAALLAESCVDEDLRDEAWWAEQLARPSYSKGDLLAINRVLLELNLNVPSGGQGNV